MNIFKAYATLKVSKISVGFIDLIKFKRSKRDFDAIVYAILIHDKAQLRCDRQRIIDHWKEGGNPLNVVHGLIAALGTNQSLSISKAIKKDKMGIDISKKLIGIGWKQRMKEITAENKK